MKGAARAALGALGLAACGTPPPSWAPDAGPCAPYQVPAGTDLAAPAVSFRADVMPLLRDHCASASCHGVADGAQGGLYLGAELDHGGDAATAYQDLVGPAAGQLGAMPYVAPGDPAHSYLMHKLDGDQCTLDATCAHASCGHAMPYDGLLAPARRDVVRRWIAQGAKDD